jgi:hypothetical protein
MSDGLILGLSTGVATPLLTLIITKYNEKGEKNLKEINETLKEIKELAQKTAVGTKTISRHRLIKDMNRIIARGSITSKELEDITILYKSYEELGGNSYVSDLFITCRKLPIKEEK